MESFGAARCEATSKGTAAILFFLCVAVSIASAFLRMPNTPLLGPEFSWQLLAEIVAVVASPLIFLCAGVVVFFRPRLGYGLGLPAGLIALPWFIWSELSLAPWNSWIFLNYVPNHPEDERFVAFVKLKILLVALTLIACACASIRLLPAYLSLRNRPVCRRTWPALALGMAVLAVWFAHSAMPYRVPGYRDGLTPEFRILHVEKRGLQFRETMVSAFRDGRVLVWRDKRRLFRYRFERRLALKTMPRERLLARAQSPELWKLHTQPARALRSWNADGWYIVLEHSRLLAFTSEYRTVPPQELPSLLSEIDKWPAYRELSFTAQDVCLGFCYDPLAALGLSDLQDRARLLRSQ